MAGMARALRVLQRGSGFEGCGVAGCRREQGDEGEVVTGGERCRRRWVVPLGLVRAKGLVRILGIRIKVYVDVYPMGGRVDLVSLTVLLSDLQRERGGNGGGDLRGRMRNETWVSGYLNERSGHVDQHNLRQAFLRGGSEGREAERGG